MIKPTLKCSKCSKLFPAEPGEVLCAKCRGIVAEKMELIREAYVQFGRRSAEDIADFTGLQLDEVKPLLASPSGKELLNTAIPVCSLCKTRPAQPRQSFCLYCRLELNKALGTAKGVLYAKLEGKPQEETPYRWKARSPSGLADALAKKHPELTERHAPRSKFL